MISFSTIERLGIEPKTIRQHGRHLYRSAANWNASANEIQVSEGVALGIVLTRYLQRFTALSDRDALSVVDFYGELIKDYAEAFVSKYRKAPREEHVPIMCLEILDGAYARVGSLVEVFDIDEQRERPAEEIVGKGLYVWSFSIALPALIGVIIEANGLIKQQKDSEGQAG